MKRALLALIPVALMTTASLALPGLTPEPLKIFTPSALPVAQAPAAPSSTTTTTAAAPVVVQQSAPTQVQPEGEMIAQASDSASTEVAQEVPLPQLVVNKTQLVEAMSFLVRATEQAKLSVTALDAAAQRVYIQETINLLAGSGDAHFRQLVQSTGTYPGTVSLLSQALQAREDAESTWLAEIEKLSGEVAGAAPATSPGVIKMLGTRGLRPEEQASQLLERALHQAVQALAVAQAKPENAIQREEVAAKFASDEASAIMEGVARLLETALKIVQIAIDR
ncbi:MAG: hypothetical protein ACRDF5_08215 [bacterium]